jgi:septum formation protein
MTRIILASGSPRRREIMDLTGLKYEVVPSEYVEDNHLDMAPPELVKHLALGKAQWVAQRYPRALVIGADTLVFLGDQVLGKPHTREELGRMIKTLSGQMNTVYTGYALVQNDRVVSGAVKADIYVRDISPDELKAYATYDDGLDKAGGYAIQGRAAAFIERIDGDYLGTIGLPLCQLVLELREFGVEAIIKSP